MSKSVTTCFIVQSLPINIEINARERRPKSKIVPIIVLARLSRLTYAFKVRGASDKEGRGAPKPILEDDVRAKKSYFDKFEFR